MITQEDIQAALKFTGYDSVDDLHYWAADASELNRFDALTELLTAHRIAAEKAVLDRLRDLPENTVTDFLIRSGYGDHLGFVDIQAISTALADALEAKP